MAGGGGIGVDTSSLGPLRAYGRERFLALLTRIDPDILFANDEEASYLSGTHDPEDGCRILQRFAATVVWKLGGGGAYACGDACERVMGLDVPALDTTGAGDAFAAAFTISSAQGLPLYEGLSRANRVAAAVVQRMGARPRLALDELDPSRE
jgi:sugar/nucleoside kinase (ribokinase family)